MKAIVLGILLLLILSGGALFHVKYQVAQIADKLRAVSSQKERLQESLDLRRAEWTFLNEQSRLEMLTQKYLPLQPTSSHQILSVSDLTAAGQVAEEHLP